MAGDKNKKGHYVQQSYLERFSSNGRQIHVFDKPQGRTFANAIRDVAQELHFYRLSNGLLDENGDSVDPLLIEKWFTPIEDEFSRNLANLLANGLADIPTRGHKSLARFIAIQKLRTRAMRNMITDANIGLARVICEKAVSINFGDEMLKYMPKISFSDHGAKLMQMQMLFNQDLIDEISEGLLNYCWFHLANDTDHSFYTSDHPVVMYRHVRGRGVGFLSKGVEIAMPLSSKLLLTLIEPSILNDESKSKANQTFHLPPETVEFYNSLQVLQSERQIYCERADFQLVEEMIARDPGLRESGKTRLSVE